MSVLIELLEPFCGAAAPLVAARCCRSLRRHPGRSEPDSLLEECSALLGKSSELGRLSGAGHGRLGAAAPSWPGLCEASAACGHGSASSPSVARRDQWPIPGWCD